MIKKNFYILLGLPNTSFVTEGMESSYSSSNKTSKNEKEKLVVEFIGLILDRLPLDSLDYIFHQELGLEAKLEKLKVELNKLKPILEKLKNPKIQEFFNNVDEKTKLIITSFLKDPTQNISKQVGEMIQMAKEGRMQSLAVLLRSQKLKNSLSKISKGSCSTLKEIVSSLALDSGDLNKIIEALNNKYKENINIPSEKSSKLNVDIYKKGDSTTWSTIYFNIITGLLLANKEEIIVNAKEGVLSIQEYIEFLSFFTMPFKDHLTFSNIFKKENEIKLLLEKFLSIASLVFSVNNALSSNGTHKTLNIFVDFDYNYDKLIGDKGKMQNVYYYNDEKSNCLAVGAINDQGKKTTLDYTFRVYIKKIDNSKKEKKEFPAYKPFSQTNKYSSIYCK